MTALQRVLYRELYRKSFYEFVKAFWHTCDPSKYVDGDLVRFYCETFQYYCRPWIGYTEIKVDVPKATDDIDVIDVRQNKSKININVPPRHSKSMVFNVLGPVWLWTYYPVKAVSVSHTAGLSSDMNIKRQKIINSDLYKELFPEIMLSANSNTSLKDTRGGELYSVNRNAFTGYGGDVIINDDLTNAETARKDKEEMSNAWSYYQNTMPSRINDLNRSLIMNIQQRLAPNDITGHIMSDPKLASQYCFVVLQAQFEKETYIVCPISGKILHFEKGGFLWPERFGDYESLKIDVGPNIFETQYQQHAIASDKAIIKEYMIVEKDKSDVPDIDSADMIYASHDFPVKDKDSSDYFGSALAYRVGSTLYFVDSLEKKMAFVRSVEYVKQLDELYPGIIQIIEDKANGSPVLQQLQNEVAGMQAYQPGTNSKADRLDLTTPYLEAKNVAFVKNEFNELTKSWQLSESMKNLKQRLLDFPYVKHDDIIDAFDMLVLFVFMDRRYMVYGRSFNDGNIINLANIDDPAVSLKTKVDMDTVFFNKEGDMWKALKIGVKYGESTSIVVSREICFKATIEEGLANLKKFAPDKSAFIDCSATPALEGISSNNAYVERYEVEDFDKSVSQLNLAFAKKRVLIYNSCNLTKSDIENFKFSKTKDDTVKYTTTKDGFVACLRVALKYYGGIV